MAKASKTPIIDSEIERARNLGSAPNAELYAEILEAAKRMPPAAQEIERFFQDRLQKSKGKRKGKGKR